MITKTNFTNDVKEWKVAEKYIQEKLRQSWLIVKNVSNNNLKYDFIITDLLTDELRRLFKVGETIDVKTNLIPGSSNFIFEVISTSSRKNIWTKKCWNIKEDWLQIYSYWWSFSENMKDTDWILFLDKDYNREEKRGLRRWFIVSRQEILKHNKEKEIKEWLSSFYWTSTKFPNEKEKYSAYIWVPIKSIKSLSFTF